MVAAKFFRMWWPETGLNRRRRPFQGRALPLSYLASVQTFELQVPARIPASPEGMGESTNTALLQPQPVYQLRFSTPNPAAQSRGPQRCPAGTHFVAGVVNPPHTFIPALHWKQSCAAHFVLSPALRSPQPPPSTPSLPRPALRSQKPARPTPTRPLCKAGL